MNNVWFSKNDEVLQCIFHENDETCQCIHFPMAEETNLTAGAYKVFLLLCEYYARQRQTSMTHKDIMKKTNYSLSGVKKALETIRDKLKSIGIEEWFDYKSLAEDVQCREVKNEELLIPEKQFAQKICLRSMDGVWEYEANAFKEYMFDWCEDRNKKSVLKEYNALFLHGDGGIGKTHYLRKTWDYCNSHHTGKEIRFCSLSVLLQEAVSSPIPKEVHCKGDVSKAVYSPQHITSYICRHCGVYRFEERKKYIFLLDGLNELISQNSSISYDYVQQILSEIRMLDMKNVFVFISSRDKKDFRILGGDVFRKRCTAVLSEIMDCDFSGLPELSDEIRTLLSRPLFYRLYQEYAEKKHFPDIQSKYELWNFFHRNACRQSCLNKNIRADEMLYLYYILLPAAAYWCACNRKEEISKFHFIQLTDKIRNSLAIQERYHCIINHIENESLVRSELQFNKLSTLYYDGLRNVGDFAVMSDDVIRFTHQDVREYFAAFYVVSYLSEIKNPSIPLLLEMVPSFNLNSDIQGLIMKKYGFEKDKHGQNAEAFGKLFGCTKELIPSISIEDLHAQFRQNITHAYAAYTFADHFMLRISEARHKVIAPFCASLLKYKDFFRNWKNILSRKEKDALTEVFTAMIQYYRIKMDYAVCRQYYEFAKEFLLDGADIYYVKMIEHQKAKAWISNSQSLYCNEAYVSLWDESLSAKTLFDEGMDKLQTCFPYNMSVNLLGNIYSKPVRWIEENQLIKRDVCEAFRIYRNFFEEMTNAQTHLWLQNGTELIYTTREMLSLLLKFYVYIDDQNNICTYDPEKKVTDLDSLQKMMPASTLAFVNSVLEKIIEQNCAFMDWLRGMALLLSGKKEEANHMFENEAANYMTWIIRYMQGDEDQRAAIDAKLSEFSANVNQTADADLTDKKYLIMDAGQLGYVLA